MSSPDFRRLAARAAATPGFLGHVLAAHQARAGLSDAQLAQVLGTTADGLTRLRLCGVPRDRADVEAVAAHVGCDADGLAAAVAG